MAGVRLDLWKSYESRRYKPGNDLAANAVRVIKFGWRAPQVRCIKERN